jgi:type VI secretion system protein VasD
MSMKPSQSIAAALLSVCVLLTACGSSQPKPDKARMTFVAQPIVNPDIKGRPSPIVVRVYQLKNDDKYTGADFFALFDDDQKVLGPDLVGRDEVELTPGESREVQFAVSPDAKFVGVLAAFRDIRNSRWRAIKRAPKKGLLSLVRKDAITITIGRDAVDLTIKD